ncbi:hypothetical protein GJW-30_1_02416 [Variibacter gotjawalensis]|uniref:DUF1134 domain-containing protein n=1 Tax=Variibacter gotjawalensis TaxID=1333996 RepID=A0A0S3PVB1_9BRAD|nr:hypothetical protein [Variibacter gotjawalensis]NIK45703.1 lipid-binding SYLF domain-containing protein [Variibacter gotjawalensis]RZS47629.1 hypothetical protein EV661_0019 [Variibacter gotjawalensis]BAT59881.1 hypothetical protein GJW-30_1_02416 [Variibacter gotjawalensis]
MRILSIARAALAALVMTVGVGVASKAHADSGRVYISVIKGGWVIGASAGSGTLTYKGRKYPLTVGGVSWGLVFGGAKTDLVGTVRNIRRPSDIAGVYGAAGAGVAIGPAGGRVVELANEKGAVLSLRGRQVGLMADIDLSGMAIGIQ